MDIESLWRFVQERERIRERKESGAPWPWTEDEALRSTYYCNVFREDDRTTRWIAKNLREPYDDRENRPGAVVFAMGLARWINRIDVLEILVGEDLVHPWNGARFRDVLRATRPKGPWVTGAYMIHTPYGVDKLEGVATLMDRYDRALEPLAAWLLEEQRSIEATVAYLERFDCWGGFMAYEVATDLRHAWPLREAPDIYSWANPGPGATRGMALVAGEEIPGSAMNRQSTTGTRKAHWLEKMREILAVFRERDPRFEARDVEHALCEYAKYRATVDGRRPKRTYRPH